MVAGSAYVFSCRLDIGIFVFPEGHQDCRMNGKTFVWLGIRWHVASS